MNNLTPFELTVITAALEAWSSHKNNAPDSSNNRRHRDTADALLDRLATGEPLPAPGPPEAATVPRKVLTYGPDQRHWMIERGILVGETDPLEAENVREFLSAVSALCDKHRLRIKPADRASSLRVTPNDEPDLMGSYQLEEAQEEAQELHLYWRYHPAAPSPVVPAPFVWKLPC